MLSIDLPANRFNSGLGSKLSTWLTPPQRKIQMTALAFGTVRGSRDVLLEAGGLDRRLAGQHRTQGQAGEAHARVGQE